MTGLPAFVLGACASAGAVLAFSVAAPRLGLSDDPSTAPHRKLQSRPVPAVGGIGVLVGLTAIEACTGFPLFVSGFWVALVFAAGVGAIDDRIRGGLPPLALLVGQAMVALSLVTSGWRVCGGEPVAALVASVLSVFVAVNAINTFDNADGAATSLGILGLSCGSPLLAAPLVGFLPFNLLGRKGSAPIAYLGNSGSQLLGVLLLLDPIGRAALLLPLLDLVRVALVRLAAGAPPWVGDRRHLAHRLQKVGLQPPFVALILVVIAAPAVLGAAASRTGELAGSLGIGALATILFFSAVVRLTPRIE